MNAISQLDCEQSRCLLRDRPRVTLALAGIGAGLPGVPYVPNVPGVARGSGDTGDPGHPDGGRGRRGVVGNLGVRGRPFS